jgi:hypothetical protein
MTELGLDEGVGPLGNVELKVEVEAAAAVCGWFQSVLPPHFRPVAPGVCSVSRRSCLVDGEGEVGLAAHDGVDLQDLGAEAGREGLGGPDAHHVGLPPG